MKARGIFGWSVAGLLFLVLAFALFTLVWWRLDPAVHWKTIEHRLIESEFARNDRISGDRSFDRSWIPLLVLENPRRHYLERSRMRLGMGFPNMDMGFYCYGTNSGVVLSVHLFDNYARGISVSCDPTLLQTRHEVERLLCQQFPGLPVRVITTSPTNGSSQ